MVFNAVYPLEDSFDFEGMKAAHKEFKAICDKLYSLLRKQTDDFTILSNESCMRCAKCTYPSGSCRYPEILFPAIEGYGIMVANLAKCAKICYMNGRNTVTYFGMLLYRNG
jgi:predicted metal-binding protein